jgi:hypothetical protein
VSGRRSSARAEGGVRVGDQVRQVVAPLGDRRHRVGRVDDEALEDALVGGELLGQVAGGDEERAEVLGRLTRLLALAVVLVAEAADDVLEALAGLRVERVEERVEVDRRGRVVRLDLAAVVDLLGVVRARLKRDVAVGDARQRRRADRRLRARVQRRVVVVELERHDRVGVLVQLDLGDRADLAAAHEDGVALDELAGVVEDRLDLVAVAAAEHRERDERDRGYERA